MMKHAYYYFLFRVFCFYKKKYKYDNGDATFEVIAVSTTVLFINLFSIYTLLNYFDLIPMFKNKFWVIPILFLIALFNYLFFIRKKKFLDYGFNEDRKGGWKVIAYIIMTVVVFIIIANFNRKKILEERKAKPPIEQPVKQNSLESEIRDWWNNR